jgi:hypothetical protein
MPMAGSGTGKSADRPHRDGNESLLPVHGESVCALDRDAGQPGMTRREEIEFRLSALRREIAALASHLTELRQERESLSDELALIEQPDD